MKKKGFTLIELLAVIVILAIIALIATPMIMDVIEKSKRGAAIESVNGILDAAGTYYAEKLIDQASYETEINLTGDLLTYKGSKPVSGTLIIDEKGQMYVIAKYGNYCIEKGFNDESPKVIEREDCGAEPEPVEISKIYGVKRSLTTESSAWERTDDSVGLIANAQIGTTEVQNDFDSIYPWSEIKSYNYNTEEGTITAWYGEDTFQFDGSNGEVLTYIPEFYYKRYQDDEYEYISISKAYQEGYEKSEAFSVGRYTISGTANDVHSRSGYQQLDMLTITEFRTYARNLGSAFGIMDYHYFILQLLYLVEYADYNSQVKLGLGNTSNTTAVQSGGCDTLGMHSGSVDNIGKTSVIYRGIEDIFGNGWQFIDGINIKDNQAYICYNQNEYESDKFDGCYEPIGYVNASTNGWISKLGYDSNHPLVAFPIETSESENAYITDYYWQQSGNKIVRVSGHWSLSTQCGLQLLNFACFSHNIGTYMGARLLKLG